MKTKLLNSKRKNKLFVFDLDHTLMHANSSFCFGMHLYKNGFISHFKLVQLLSLYFFHKLGFLSIAKVHEATFKLFFKNASVKAIESEVDLFLEKQFHSLIFEKVYKELKRVKKEGIVVLLSSSPDFLVSKIATLFGIDIWNSTIYQKDTFDRFSRLEFIMQGQEKLEEIKKIAQNFNISLNAVTAYTDSHLDLPLLEAVGTPIAVNPDRKLKSISKAQNWAIL